MSHFPVAEDGGATIRPLETLHNALSLRQLDNFLEFVTTANFRTPSHSPPRVGDGHEDSEEGLSLPKLYPKSLALISPQSSFGWSTSCSQPISGNSPPHLSMGSDLMLVADSNTTSLQMNEVLPMDDLFTQQLGPDQSKPIDDTLARQLEPVLPMDDFIAQQLGPSQLMLPGQDQLSLSDQHQQLLTPGEENVTIPNQEIVTGQEQLLIPGGPNLGEQLAHPMSSQVSPHELLSKVRKLSEEQK